MTIIIPYRDEVHKGLELRYALRSIKKYLSGYDRIFIIANYFPALKYDHAFDNECLLSIACDDHPGRKEFSIYNKLLAACNDERVSDDFILWNDDHYLLKPLHVSEIKYWHNGLLRDELMSIKNGEVRTAGGRYRKAIEHTLEIIGEQSLNYDIHVPAIFNKEKFKQVFGNRQDELCVKSMYCDYYFKSLLSVNDSTIFGEFMPDLKIPFQMPYERLKEKIADRLFFSIDSAAIGPDMIRLWEELYPTKSKFES